MARTPSRRLRIDEDIASAIDKIMLAMHRHEDLSNFVEWVMDLYCKGYLKETEEYRDKVAAQFQSIVPAEVQGRRVHRVGPAKGILEGDEGKRKTS